MTTESGVGAFLEEIVRINPLQSSFVESSLHDATPEEREELANYIRYCENQSLDISYLAQCYDVIVKDTLREQVYFQRHGRYRYSTFAEVADSVYFDDDYMSKYMHGLAITAWLWPNHREMHRYFASTLPKEKKGTYLEVGPGHGVYMMTAMKQSRYERFEGIDLSPTSVAMTSALLESRDVPDGASYEIYCSDFLKDELKQTSYDAIVMGEVLEHVEEPLEFLQKIRDLASKDAYIFITTPINAPAIDHIYLFDSFAAIEDLVSQAQLSVRDYLEIPYPGETVEQSVEQRLPINVALVLGK